MVVGSWEMGVCRRASGISALPGDLVFSVEPKHRPPAAQLFAVHFEVTHTFTRQQDTQRRAADAARGENEAVAGTPKREVGEGLADAELVER